MNETQTVFTVFYAIFWGSVANVQPRWKAFQWPLVFDFDFPQARHRIARSLFLLNLCPMVFFGLMIWILSGPKELSDFWTWEIVIRIVCCGVVPAFAILGFYRLWIGIVERNPNHFFYVEKQIDLPKKYRRVTDNSPEIEPTVEGLGIRPDTCWKNILFGLVYVLTALAIPIFYITLFKEHNIMGETLTTIYSAFLNIIPIVSVVLTAIAAIGACLSARATKHTSQGQLFFTLLSDYSSEEMLKALTKIGEVKEKNKKTPGYLANMVKYWEENRTERNKIENEYPEVNGARRRISHHFLRALELYENGECVDKRFLEVLCEADGFVLLYEVVEHLEKALNPQYAVSKFDKLLSRNAKRLIEISC